MAATKMRLLLANCRSHCGLPDLDLRVAADKANIAFMMVANFMHMRVRDRTAPATRFRDWERGFSRTVIPLNPADQAAAPSADFSLRGRGDGPSCR